MRDIKANALTDVKVELISLVKRGANRIPFRLTKEDTGSMLDFTKFFQKADDAGVVAAKAALNEKLKKEAAAAEAAKTVPTASDAASALVNAQEILRAAGYTVMLAEAPQNSDTPEAKAATASDKAAASDKVKKDEEAAALVVEIEKAEAVLAALKKSSPVALADGVNKSKNKQTVIGDGVAAADGSEEGGDGDEEIADKPVVGDKDSTAATRKVVAKIEEGQLALAKSIGELTAFVKATSAATDKRMGVVESAMKKAEEAVNGTVHGAANDDDTTIRVRKSAGVVPPLLDTAFAHGRV